MVSLDLQHKLVEDINLYTRVVILGDDKFGLFKNYNLNDLKKEYIEKFTDDILKRVCSNKKTAKKMAKNIVEHIFEKTLAEIQSIN